MVLFSVDKVASSTWVRLLVYYSGRADKGMSFSQIDVHREEIREYGLVYLNDDSMDMQLIMKYISETYSFIFGRNPFERYKLLIATLQHCELASVQMIG